MSIKKLLKEMVDIGASDLFYRAGGVARFRVDGRVVIVDTRGLTVDDVTKGVEELTTLKQREAFRNNSDVDFVTYIPELDRRFRVDIFMQRNWPSIVVRNVSSEIKSFEELNLPADALKKLSMEMRGMVLLTGTMGSGKSTTIASMIEYINNNSKKHILTVEEPIEFTFQDKESLINQRELGVDVSSYAAALRSFTLQSPDVMFISNIRDYNTMFSVVTAAETGVLVLSTLHTVNASQSIERIVNFFPPHQHQEARNQLAVLLKGVISLRLVPRRDGAGRIPAYEVMLLTPTISRLIREGKFWEIPRFIKEGEVFGMQSFEQSLIKLIKDGKISKEEAIRYADNRDDFDLVLKGVTRE